MRRPSRPPQFVEAPTTQKPFYSARTGPLRPQTVWSLEDGQLVESCGRRRKSWALSALRKTTLVGEPGSRWRAAHLLFGGRRVVIPAQSLQPNLSFQDRSPAFDAFLVALDAALTATASYGRAAPGRARQAAQAVVWAMILTGAGALFMIVAALVSGLPDLGLALGARLLFAPILLAAALPWLTRTPG